MGCTGQVVRCNLLSCALFYMRSAWLLCFLLLLCCSPATGQVADSLWLKGGVVGGIVIEGNVRTRTKVILREMSIKAGDRIAADSMPAMLRLNQQRIYNLQLFNEVVQRISHGAQDTIYWKVSVKERWAIIPTGTLQFADRNFNTWWVEENHDIRRAIAGLTLTDKNFRGNLEVLAATVQIGYTQKLGISYMKPYVNKAQTSGIGFSFSMGQSRQTYYATDSDKLVYAGTYSGPVVLRQAEGAVSYIYRPGYASRHIVQAAYKNYKVADTILQLNHDYFSGGSSRASFAELQYRYEYNGTDNWNYSLQGYKLVGNAVARVGFEGIKFQSYANVEAGMYRKLAPRWYTGATLRGRLMYPQDQPYYFRGGLGTQTDYVRGYEYYVTDGYNYGLLRLDLKRELFNNTYRVPIKYFTAFPVRVYPKVFFDAGYINMPDPGNSRLSNRLLYSAGVGVDVVTLYDIKIRIEYAINHLGQNGLYLHFNSE